MRRLRVPLWLKVLVSGLLLVAVIAKVDFAALAGTMAHSDPRLLVLAGIMTFAAQGLNTYKWHVLLGGLGTTSRFRVLLRLSFVGMLYNLVLPGQIGGELVKSVRLTGLGVPASRAALSVVLDRVSGLLGLLLLGVIGAVLSPPPVAGHSQFLDALSALTLVLAGVTAVLMTRRGRAAVLTAGQALGWPARWWPGRAGGPDAETGPTVSPLITLWLPLLLTLVFQAIVACADQLLCWSLGMSLTFPQVLWVVAVVSLLQALPISVAGLGIREGAFVYLLTGLGTPAPPALALSLLVFTLQVVMAGVGGLVQLHEQVQP